MIVLEISCEWSRCYEENEGSVDWQATSWVIRTALYFGKKNLINPEQNVDVYKSFSWFPMKSYEYRILLPWLPFLYIFDYFIL